MKKTILITLLVLVFTGLKAQINESYLKGSWVKIKTTLNSNTELPDIYAIKYSYVKYTFTAPGKIGISTLYNTTGIINDFYLNDSVLVTNNKYGILNELKIIKLTANELVVVQKGEKGFNDPYALKFYLIPETDFQRKGVFTTHDISKLATGDTVYNESPKVYATFNGGDEIQTYLTKAGISMDQQEGHFKSSFIVMKTGEVDSLKILNGINADYDKQFVKWFTKNKKSWTAAKLNGKPVNVKMIKEMRYFTSDRMQPYFRYNTSADNALNQGNYRGALFFYDQALTYLPDNIDDIYKRAACKIILGATNDLCDDMAKIKASGAMLVDELIDKYCVPAKN